MRTIIAVLVVVLTAWAIPALTDTVSDPERKAFAERLRNFEVPLVAELEKKGLAEIDAKIAAKKAVDDLVLCIISQTENVESLFDNIIIRLGGKTIITAGTPCIYEFLELAGVSDG